MDSNKKFLTGAELLAYIENSAGLRQYSLNSVYSMEFSERGLVRKEALESKVAKNLELLEHWVKSRDLGPITLAMCKRLYRQNLDLLKRIESQRKDIQDWLTLQQLNGAMNHESE